MTHNTVALHKHNVVKVYVILIIARLYCLFITSVMHFVCAWSKSSCFIFSDSPSWLNNAIIFINIFHGKLISVCSVSSSHLTPSLQSARLLQLLLSYHVFIFDFGESGTRREELGRVVGTRGAAVRGWTSEGFYKNNSLTDNLLASSLQQPQVPFGEGAFLFQLHIESPESQGWSLWVLIAFFPLFCQSAYSDEGKKGMKALQTLMKRSTNSFFFVDSPPACRMSCGGGRGVWAALCLIGWHWGQCGEFGCFLS